MTVLVSSELKSIVEAKLFVYVSLPVANVAVDTTDAGEGLIVEEENSPPKLTIWGRPVGKISSSAVNVVCTIDASIVDAMSDDGVRIVVRSATMADGWTSAPEAHSTNVPKA